MVWKSFALSLFLHSIFFAALCGLGYGLFEVHTSHSVEVQVLPLEMVWPSPPTDQIKAATTNRPLKQKISPTRQPTRPSTVTEEKNFDKISSAYAQQLKAHIESQRFYPPKARRLKQSGTVQIRLTIEQDGNFSKIEALQNSTFDSINRAAMQLISQIQFFRPLPAELGKQAIFVIPISYQLKGDSK